MIRKFVFLLVFGAFSTFASVANAILIDYSIDGVGSGSLDGSSFDDAAFSINLVGDTANFSSNGGFNAVDPLESATVTVTGLGTTTINIATRLGINSGNTVFFSRAGITGTDLFDFDVGLPIDLTMSFGPVSNTGAVFALNQFQNISSSLGLLSFDAARDISFQGSIRNQVPEPATLGLFGLGLAGLGFTRRKKA